MPDIRLLQSVTDNEADQLKAMCPMGVFDIEDLGGGGGVAKKGSRSSSSSSSSSSENSRVAVVKNPRDCTMCRECIRLEGWSDKVPKSNSRPLHLHGGVHGLHAPGNHRERGTGGTEKQSRQVHRARRREFDRRRTRRQ